MESFDIFAQRRFVRTWEAFNVADLIDSIFPSFPCLFISIADKRGNNLDEIAHPQFFVGR